MRKLLSENSFFGNTCSLISHVHISEINISADEKWMDQNGFIGQRGAARVLLFSFKLSSGAN